jgi:hypothetical protein
VEVVDLEVGVLVVVGADLEEDDSVEVVRVVNGKLSRHFKE